MSNSAEKQKGKSQKDGRNAPNNPKEHHRLEAVTCIFLSVWITADILVVYGHTGLALWVFYFALSLPLYLLAHHTGEGWPKWKTRGKWFLLIILLFLPGMLFVLSRLATFSIERETTFYSKPMTRDGGIPMFWCVHPRITDAYIPNTEASPVYILMYARITNERETPMFVDSFSVETRNKNGKWEKMPVFDIHPTLGDPVEFYGLIIINKGLEFALENAKKINFGDAFLQSRLSEHSLNPYEPIQGWLMLDIPKDGVANENQMRFSIKTGGKIITQPIKGPFESTDGLDIQIVKHNAWFQGTETRDISHIPLRFYGDGADFPHP